MANHQPHHFLVVAIGIQSHINPVRHLSLRLAQTFGSRVSIAIPIHTLTKMFPSSKKQQQQEESNIVIVDEHQRLISYISYSDGIEDGLNPGLGARNVAIYKKHVAESLERIARDHGITCVIHTLLLPMAAGVASSLGIPSVLFWIQPASMFILYYHYYLGADTDVGIGVESSRDLSSLLELPGLPRRLQIGDIPSFLTADYAPNAGGITDPLLYLIFTLFQDLFLLIRQNMSTGSKTKVLINTFYDLEPTVLSSFKGAIEMIPIGPLVSLDVSANCTGNLGLFEQDRNAYMDWLDIKDRSSVVYVSFGSLSVLSEKQTGEIFKGLEESGRPYLWVLREDNRTGVSMENVTGNGMMVQWCDQMRVLSHGSIGCFVTHCGWNSMMEGLVGGVPVVMVPRWLDQGVNSRLGEEWGIGVRAAVNEADGAVEGEELKRCLDLVMGDEKMRKAAEAWKEKAREAMTSNQNLEDFVRGL